MCVKLSNALPFDFLNYKYFDSEIINLNTCISLCLNQNILNTPIKNILFVLSQ